MPIPALKYPFILAACLLSFQGLWAQSPAVLKNQGNERFDENRFLEATTFYEAYLAQAPNASDVLEKLGICHFELGNLGEAEKSLNALVNSTGNPSPKAWLYLGKLHHEQFQFEKAIQSYKKFLQQTVQGAPLRAAVKSDILRCANGIRIRRLNTDAAVVNLGGTVNSAGDEFKPIQSKMDDVRLYFAKSKLGTDGSTVKSNLYSSDLKNGDWDTPKPMSVFLNSVGHEMPLGFDEKGKLLYFFRGETFFSGDILIDTLRENTTEGTLFLHEFTGPLRAWEGDRDLFFFTDSIVLFASRRPGGYGGLDLYVATLRPDGWSAAENLGPVINSAFDEASPFLASDGRTLYFSTNDTRRSIGGLDLVRSVFLDRAQKWTPAENLGIPFNSAGDDEHIFLTPDGKRAFFSSSRKTGLGQRDLYVGIFEKTKTEQLKRSQPVAFLYVIPENNEKTATAPPVETTSTDGVFKLTPLSFPEPNMPFTEASFAKLEEVAEWVKKHPELRVTFVAHVDLGDERSIADAALQQVREVLASQNVPMNNIVLRNAAAAFPLPAGAGPENRRVDILLANPEILPVEVSLPELPNSRASFFQRAMGRLVFQVKIPVREQGDTSSLYGHFPDGNLLTMHGSGYPDFVHGIYLTWNSALEAQREMVRNGFPEARAVPFLRGWELSAAEAEALVGEYPELQGFIGQ